MRELFFFLFSKTKQTNKQLFVLSHLCLNGHMWQWQMPTTQHAISFFTSRLQSRAHYGFLLLFRVGATARDFCGQRQGRQRGRALISIQGSTRFAGAINLRQSSPWAVCMHWVLGEGEGSREGRARDLEINDICSLPSHPDLVISWGHRKKKNTCIQNLYLA